MPTTQLAREALRATGLTQRALADTLGVTVSTVEHWLSGRRCPTGISAKVLKLLADYPADTLELLRRPPLPR
jgi:DNA-binding transcriptional regulator YiaG